MMRHIGRISTTWLAVIVITMATLGGAASVYLYVGQRNAQAENRRDNTERDKAIDKAKRDAAEARKDAREAREAGKSFAETANKRLKSKKAAPLPVPPVLEEADAPPTPIVQVIRETVDSARLQALVAGYCGDGRCNEPEIQSPEIQDPEVQDPEVQDPEVDDPDPNDPDPNDPDPVDDPDPNDPDPASPFDFTFTFTVPASGLDPARTYTVSCNSGTGHCTVSQS